MEWMCKGEVGVVELACEVSIKVIVEDVIDSVWYHLHLDILNWYHFGWLYSGTADKFYGWRGTN